ncbi:ABC transporter ATP-binding protein [Microlunatus soli]|uniref:ABC-type quaternary amine transporter n=1 Tax=Microlunatus soli TaxID=630515 RepID=A0A1H1VHQ1_9ACTN|nr:ATP-binding cassette domain-containing protein [Microlunatus soli]SDS83826.1 osmoprotectant transport system ATP-binding protein [Microlunatus soli]
MDGDVVIEFESVTKRYRDGTTAVQDLSLTIPSDKITVIVGPSGCGKTTTLRMINRMLEPTSGSISWDGAPLKSKRKTQLRRQMGYVIQSGGLFPHRTVIENIQTVPTLIGWDKTKNRNRAYELLEMVGLERKLAQRYPSQLSGGQQQRVGVARALAADPIVMLMDEPFSAVDPVVRADLHEQFLQLQKKIGKTIVMITHDIDEAIKLGDQIAIMRKGGVLAQVGSPQQLLEEPVDDFVAGFVGKDRGYRGLSFVAASGLPLENVQLTRDPAAAHGDQPVLVVDEDATPLGWADLTRPGQTQMLGSTFLPETDTMRVALDSALNSPVGLAVAVAANGRFAGVVTASQILDQVRYLKASVADAISARAEADAARREAEAARQEAEGVRNEASRIAAEADAEADEAARVEEAVRAADEADAKAAAAEQAAAQKEAVADQVEQQQAEQEHAEQQQAEQQPEPERPEQEQEQQEQAEQEQPTEIRPRRDVAGDDQGDATQIRQP